MRSQTPFWSVKVEGANEFSVHPSVDSTTCGAHFWIKNSEVIWCD
ncbi:DUF6527 family protein [Methylophilus flavus]|uniref:DUF6527 family protein n=1 Tax=Methylophilus flavus TaxID=640084 RepID=A0ABW3PFK5_9PROT